jgi:hypothetical protein
MKALLRFLSALVVAAVPAAALEWSVQGMELKTVVGQEKAVAVFPFRNRSDKPVRIISVMPSCSCMATAPAKEVYAPGEAGEIRVEIALSGYVGRLRRSVAVETDEAAARFADLTMTLDIPEAVVLNPRFLFWEVGDKPEEKHLEIMATEPAKTSVGEIVSSDPAFQARLEATGRPGVFRLWVRPKDTQSRIDATIRLNVVLVGRPETRVVYVAVK